MRRILWLVLVLILTGALPVTAQTVVSQGRPASTSDANSWPVKTVYGGVQIDPRSIRPLTTADAVTNTPAYLQVTGTIAALNDAVTIDCRGYTTVGVSLEGSFTGTLTPFSSMDNGSHYKNAQLYLDLHDQNNGGSVRPTITNTPASQNYSFTCAPYTTFKIQATAWTSGSIAVTLTATAAGGYTPQLVVITQPGTSNGNAIVTNGWLNVAPGNGSNNYVVSGSLSNNDAQAVAGGPALGVANFSGGFNGNSWDRLRSHSLTNDAVATTLTGRNLIGTSMVDKPSRWAVTSSPAAGTQASASIANEANVRHVVDCVSFSGGSTTAPALTALTVTLRDGATGAGTVIWQHTVVVSAVTGENVPPYHECGLNLVGTTNTAMTFEFSAGLANLIETANISGFNVN